MAKRGGNLGEQVIDGAAAFGRFMALVSLIIGGVISLVLFCIGLYLLLSKGKYTEVIEGTVTKSECKSYTNTTGKNTTQGVTCALEVQYVIGNNKYTLPLTTSNTYQVNQKIQLVYNPADPRDAKEKVLSRAIWGWILIGIAVFIILAASLHYYLVNRFKVAAAAAGIGQGVGMVASAVD